MRWDELFADLEAQQTELARQERELEVAEHTRAERGQITLTDRLVAAEEARAGLRLRVAGQGWVTGRVRDVGDGWLVVDQSTLDQHSGADRHAGARTRSDPAPGSELLVVLAAVTAVEGLRHRVAGSQATAPGRRLGLRSALRALSRDRAVVRLHTTDGDHLTGTIDRVLADHLDLARHSESEARRRAEVRGVVSVPSAALAMLRRL